MFAVGVTLVFGAGIGVAFITAVLVARVPRSRVVAGGNLAYLAARARS